MPAQIKQACVENVQGFYVFFMHAINITLANLDLLGLIIFDMSPVEFLTKYLLN